MSVVLPVQFAFAGPAAAFAPVTNADGRLGMDDILPGSPAIDSGPTWAQLAYSAGARTNRWEFRMDKLEPTQGTWDFSATDTVVENDTAHGLDTEGILIGTPGWAVRPGGTAGNGLPKGLGRPITDPANVWADYVRQTVSHYSGRVAYWEIWNEPDLKYFWTSSAADYYQLLKVSYLVIKSVDPIARVVVAGMVVPDLSFFGAVLAAARSDTSSGSTHGYFDIAAWHAYGQASMAYTSVKRMQALLAANGYAGTPVWVTEAGFPASNPNGEERQAAYVLQTIAYAFAAGAERVFVYRSSDDPTPKTWGLISGLGFPRAAFTSFAVAAQYLSHVQAATYDPTPDTERFVFYTAHNRVSLLWNHATADRPALLSAAQPTAQLVDWQGAVSPLSAAGGQFHFTAAGATYNKGPDPAGTVVGGPPVLIVENNTRPAGLGTPAYIPPVAGTQRQLVLLNDGPTPASVEVSVPGIAAEREEVRLRPYAVQLVDLDLLGGAAYTGLFRVSSNATVTAQALSGSVPLPGIAPSSSWTVSAAPSSLLISNPSATPVTARITGFGYGGTVRVRQSVTLGSLGTAQWSPPSKLHNRALSLSIRVAGKILVSGIGGPLINAVQQPRTTWYTVSPSASHLVVFNPQAVGAAQVQVRYVGAAARSRQVDLRGHRSFTFPTQGARTIVVSASRPVSLGYSGPTAAPAPLLSQPARRTALTAGGTATRVAIFNPSGRTAHLRMSVVGRNGGFTVTGVDPPSGVYTLLARKPGDAPRGVVVSSDVPVVSSLST